MDDSIVPGRNSNLSVEVETIVPDGMVAMAMERELKRISESSGERARTE